MADELLGVLKGNPHAFSLRIVRINNEISISGDLLDDKIAIELTST